MGLSDLAKSAAQRNRLDNAPPAAVTLVSVEVGVARAVMLLDGPLGKAGTQVTLKQAPDIKGIGLDAALKGRRGAEGDDVHPSGPGCVLVFEHALRDGDDLVVGRLATRVHDGMERGVQIGYMLARPTKSSVSKRGITQFGVLADPSAATVVSDRAGFSAFADDHLTRPWPGGRFGVLLRRGRDMLDVLSDADDRSAETVTDFVERMIDENDILREGALEVMPIWQLPMGREQAIRDVDPRVETTQAILGRFGRLYGEHRPRFQPSLVILGDEDEWAFGAKTGRVVRAVSGMHPLRNDMRFDFNDLPTPRYGGHSLVPIKWLYKDNAGVERAAAERRERRLQREAERDRSPSVVSGRRPFPPRPASASNDGNQASTPRLAR